MPSRLNQLRGTKKQPLPSKVEAEVELKLEKLVIEK